MMRRTSLTLCLLLLVLAGPMSPRALGQNATVIKADKVFTVSHGIIEPGMVLVENGKIVRVAPAIPVPAGAKVITAKVVVPGLVDMHTHLGVYSLPRVPENQDGNEATDPITPQVQALDSFNFDDPAIKASVTAGVTTIVSRPGSANVIGGTSVAVKLKNAPPDQMVLKPICDLKMAIEGNPVGVYGTKNQAPGTLMGVYYLARKAFVEAQEYQKAWETYEAAKASGKDPAPPKRDLGKDAIVMALKRQIPVHIHCATASEIATSIRFADEFHLRLSLGHAYWANLIVSELKSRTDVHFNVGPPMMFSYYDAALTFKNTPAILANAGLKVSLQTDALGGNQMNLLHLASLCARFGMKEEAALKAVTLAPAEGVGLDARIGSIDEGKDADLVLLDGPPLELTTSIDAVLIDGRIEYQREGVPSAQALSSIAPAKGRLALPAGLDQPGQLAIKAGTILPISGPPIKNGTILIDRGRITQVGTQVAVPAGYKVIEAGDFVVMPGLVSARSYVGLNSNWRQQSAIDELSKPVVPEMEVKHAIEPQAPHFEFARECGVTTVLVTPGNGDVLGGRGAVLKTAGLVVDKMIIKDQAVMVGGLGVAAKRKDSMPTTRMGIAALLREALVKAREYQAKLDAAAKAVQTKDAEKKDADVKRDLSMEALLPVLTGKMPLLVHCERRDDILTALRIADEFKLRLILDGAVDAYKLADEIKKRNIPVILENTLRGLGSVEDAGFTPQNPALLAAKGIRLALKPQDQAGWTTPSIGQPGGDLLVTAAVAVREGLPEDAALRAITLDAAAIAGVDARVGSLEAGKDADLLILRGHPFRTGSVPEAVFIDGRLVYQRKDNHLE
jgi:imidazolonepropionase-like amidohydrolase